MISEWLGGDPGRCAWSAERDRERPRAWDAFVAELRHHHPHTASSSSRSPAPRPSPARSSAVAPAGVPGRSARPRRGTRPLARGERGATGSPPDGDGLRPRAPRRRARARRLRSRGRRVCLGAAAHRRAGLGHSPLLSRPLGADRTGREPDVLSFDLALDPIDATARRVLRQHLASGRWIAWGAFRVERAEHVMRNQGRLQAALGALEVDPARSLLTPACGTGRMSIGRERETAVGLLDLARE